jgi:hypothetical protein
VRQLGAITTTGDPSLVERPTQQTNAAAAWLTIFNKKNVPTVI